MRIDFIYRAVKISFVLAFLGFLFVTRACGAAFGFGFLAGAVWSALNFWGLASLIQSALAEHPDKKKIFLLFLLKFPVLYGAGFVIVFYTGVDVLGVLVGFSLPLVVVILKTGGRIMHQKGVLDPREERGEEAQA